MFVNREREYEFLDEHYQSRRAELIVISGRRRMGKTTLLSHFCEDEHRPYIFFIADFGSETLLLRRLSEAMLAFETGTPGYEGFTFESWDAAFARMAHLARDARVLIVLDEFPYLIKANAGLPSVLQRLWDELLRQTQLMLVLTGSNLSIMRQDVLAYRSPLYGRRTGQWFLGPLAPWDAGQMLHGYNKAQRLEAYAALGGVPAYLEQFDDRRSVLVNIERRILRHGAMLYEEPRALLASELELREPATYYAILRAIASGHRSPTAIARAIGKPSASHVQRYLDVLANGLQLIHRDLPVGPHPPLPRQRGRWKFADHFFAFWFTFVYPRTDMLERGASRTVLDNHVRPNWASFVGRYAWEAACREHVWRLATHGTLDFLPNQVGRWWSTRHEIDIVAVSHAERRVLLGEARWTTQKVGRPLLEALMQKRSAWLASASDQDWDVVYALFARDFTADLRDLASEEEHVLLFDTEDVMGSG